MVKRILSLALAAALLALCGITVSAYDCDTCGRSYGDCICEHCDGVMHYAWYQCEVCGFYISNQNWCTEDCWVYQN